MSVSSLHRRNGASLFAAGLIAAFSACSESSKESDKLTTKRDSAQDSRGKEVASDSADGQTKSSSAGSSDDSGDSDEASLTLEQIIKQCGVDESTISNPDAVVMQKSLKSWPKVFVGTEAAPIVGNVNYRVRITTKVDVTATMSEMRQITDFIIDATPSQALGPAEEKVRPNRGTMRAKILTTEERTKLMGDVDSWSGIICTVQPAKEMTTDKGSGRKTVKFNPPLPVSVSPKADKERYLAELDAGRSFDNIEAEVFDSSDPSMPTGKKLKGKVTITKVPPTLTLKIGDKTQNINADLAFRLDFSFGSVQETVALGLQPSQTFFINHAKRDFKVIVADTGFKEGGTVVLSDEL